MLITYREYPYPVLSYFSDDYNNHTFKSEINYEVENGMLNLKIDLELTSETLKELINKNKAIFVAHIECKNTRYRKKYTTNTNQFNISISQEEINDDVEVLLMIVSKTNMNDFTSNEFNEDFQGIEFTIEKGDILAIDTNKIINVQKDDDGLKKTPSIFSISSLDNNKESLNWEPGTEKILIILSKNNFEKYKSINNNPMFKSVLATLIVLPVITEIICKYEELEEEYEDSRWFRVLEKQLTKAGVNMDTINSGQAVAIAQKILPGLLEKSLVNIEQLLMQEGE